MNYYIYASSLNTLSMYIIIHEHFINILCKVDVFFLPKSYTESNYGKYIMLNSQ
jgi:hypothetical protein